MQCIGMVTSEFYLFRNRSKIILLFFINSYDPDEHKWTNLPVPLLLRENFAASCLQNHLFLACKNSLKSVICYIFDPATRQWTQIKSLDFETITPGYIETSPEIVNGELQILITHKKVIKFYRFDFKSEKWSKVSTHPSN